MLEEVVQNMLLTLLNKELVLQSELASDVTQLIQIRFFFPGK